jgi:hypothetical protein
MENETVSPAMDLWASDAPPPGGFDAAPPAFGPHAPAFDDAAPAGKAGLKTWLTAGLVAAAFGLGGFFGIQALTHHTPATASSSLPLPGAGGFPGGGGTFGTISAIGSSNLTITMPDGSTINVTTSGSTAVTKSAAGSVSDIHAADHVVIEGTTSGSTVTADHITDTGANADAGPVGRGGPGNAVAGTVASIANGAFTVNEATGGTLTVKTAAMTTITVVQPSTVAALAVGDTVRVTGTTSNGTVAATTIQAGATDFGPGPGGGGGGPGPGGFGGFGGPPA